MSTGLFDDIEDEQGTGLFDDLEDEPSTGLFDDIEDEPLIQPVPYTRPPNEATHPANIPDLTGMPVSPEAVAAATRAASMGISLNLAKSPLFDWYNQNPSEQDVRNAYTNAQKRIETPDKTIKQPTRTLGMDDYPANTTVPVYTPEQKVDNFVSANVLQQAVEQGTSPEGLSPADLGLHRESLLAKAGLSPATSSILWYDPATGKTEQRFVNPEQVPGSSEWRAADSARWPGSDRWRDTYNADGTFTPGAWSNIGNAVVKRAVWDPDNQSNRLRLSVTGENWAKQAVETVAAVPGMFLHGMLLASDLASVALGTATGAQGVVDENTRDFKDRLVSAGGAALDMIETTSQRLEYPEHFVHEYPMDAVGLMVLPGIGVKIASGMAGRIVKEGSKAQKFFLSTAKAADYAVNLTDPFNLIVKGHGLARELTKGKAKTTITANQPVDVSDPSYIQPGEYTDTYYRLNAFASPENYNSTRAVWDDGSSATLHSIIQKRDTVLAGVVQDAVDHGKAIPKEFAPTLDDFLRTEGDRAMLVTEAADMPGAPLGREGGGVWDAEVDDTVANVDAVATKQGTGVLNTPADVEQHITRKLTPEQAIREAELRPQSLTHYAHAHAQGMRPDAIPLDHLDRANMYAELSSMSTEQRQNRAIRLEPHPSDPTQGPIQFAGDELLSLLTPAERAYLQWVHDRFSGNTTRLKGATIAYRADDGTLIQAVPGDPASNYPVGVQPETGFDIGVSAAATRTSIFRQGAESVERGLLAKETFLNTADDYLADIYPRAPEAVAPMFGKNTVGIQGDRFRKAKNKRLPLAERRKLGMVANARLTSAITLAEVGSDLRTAELLDKLHVAKLPDGRPFAAAIPQGPKHLYPKLPEGKRYGKLSGKHVPADAHKWLTRMNEPLAHQTYLKYLGMYKEGATVWRPAGQVRNYVSEFVKATMNGTLSPTGLRVLDGLAKEVWNKTGPRYTEGVRNGLISHRSSLTEYSATKHSEIADMVDAGVIGAAKGNPLAAPSKVMEVMEKVWAKTGGAYGKAARKTWGFSDDLFKHWRFQFIAELQRQFKKSGGKLTSEMVRAFDSVDEAIQVLSGDMSWAAKDAQKWHFDYADIPVAVEWAKKWYAPFMTYQFKALPLMSKWMTNHPLEAFAWRNTFNTVNTMAEAYATGGITEEESLNRMWAMEDLSAYDKHAAVMFGSTMVPKMGDDEEGQESYVTSNVANYTPLGQPVNVDLPNYTSVIPGLPNASNPILTAAAAVFNRDPRSPARGDLSNRAGGSERSVLVGDIVDAVGSSWIPGWRETKKLYAAIKEEPLSRRPYNVVKGVAETAAEVLGGVRMNYIPKDQAGNAMRRRFEDAERNILAELRKELAEKPRAKHEDLKADATRRINELRAGLMQLNNDLERRARARTL